MYREQPEISGRTTSLPYMPGDVVFALFCKFFMYFFHYFCEIDRNQQLAQKLTVYR